MRIACLHTAQLHEQTFDGLFRTAAPAAVIRHWTAPELLATARSEGLSAVRSQTEARLTALLAAHDAVLCTCSTLGPLLDAPDLATDRLVRIDRPLMAAALAHGPKVMLAFCLESTREPSLELLTETAAALGRPVRPRLLSCAEAWPLFERGETAAFAEAVARAVRRGAVDQLDAVALAQASMRPAEPLLSDIAVPVLSSPTLAAAATIAAARAGLV